MLDVEDVEEAEDDVVKRCVSRVWWGDELDGIWCKYGEIILWD